MAIGDKGAAKGLIIYPSTQDKREGYQNDNQRADDIADVIDMVNGLDTAKQDAIIIADLEPGGVPIGTIWGKPV